MAGNRLQNALLFASQQRYDLLTKDRLREAKQELKDLLKGVAGAESDNVEALGSFLHAAAAKDWAKVAILIPDAQIDYATLMMECRKGGRPVPRTIPSDRFAGVDDLKDIPNELVSISLAMKQREHQSTESEEKLKENLNTAQDRDQINTVRKQKMEIRRLRNRVNALSVERLADGVTLTTGPAEEGNSTELTEMYNLIYSGEWKVAVEYLHSKRTDQKGGNIKTLADILEASFQYCKHLATNQFQDMWEKMVYPMEKVPEWLKVSQNVQKNASKSLKKFRKETSAYAIPSLQMVFTRRHLEKILDADLHSVDILNYAKKCVEVCWLFNIEDPPLCLLWARDGQIISDHLTIYSGSGDVVYYNVWPALLLYEGGALLSKGVVQPTSSKIADK